MPTYWFDATDSNAHPDDPSELYDIPDADALADADKVRPVTVADDPETIRDSDFETDAAAVDAGVCPWCPDDDPYEGDHVGRHASSAHPDEWDAYRDDA
jgi:hypothetical protein